MPASLHREDAEAHRGSCPGALQVSWSQDWLFAPYRLFRAGTGPGFMLAPFLLRPRRPGPGRWEVLSKHPSRLLTACVATALGYGCHYHRPDFMGTHATGALSPVLHCHGRWWRTVSRGLEEGGSKGLAYPAASWAKHQQSTVPSLNAWLSHSRKPGLFPVSYLLAQGSPQRLISTGKDLPSMLSAHPPLGAQLCKWRGLQSLCSRLGAVHG